MNPNFFSASVEAKAAPAKNYLLTGNQFKMTMLVKTVDIFHMFSKLQAGDWHFTWCYKLLEQRKFDQSSCHSSVHSLQLTSSSASVAAALCCDHISFDFSPTCLLLFVTVGYRSFIASSEPMLRDKMLQVCSLAGNSQANRL